MLELTSGRSSLVVDELHGGRLASLVASGAELLVRPDAIPTGRDDPMLWGLYPMVPFAGRVQNGLLTFEGVDHQLPITDGNHAIHGYGFVSEWTAIDDQTIECQLADPWPFPGRVVQHFALTETRLAMTMTVHAEVRQPVMIGWHPWWTRTNSAGELDVELDARLMYERDDDGIPTGEMISPPGGPYDDCFADLSAAPTLRWGDLVVRLESSAPDWVMYSEPAHAVCVEPQTGPPNHINVDPIVVEAGDSFSASFTIDWSGASS